MMRAYYVSWKDRGRLQTRFPDCVTAAIQRLAEDDTKKKKKRMPKEIKPK